MDQQKKTLCIAGSMILPIAIGQPAVIMLSLCQPQKHFSNSLS